ncbi:MAG: ArnT family glycosyltransferase, partial [Nitrososphaerales archaeon]
MARWADGDVDASEVSVDRIKQPAQRNALLIALLLIALLLRVIPWLANLPLHHDEALYGTWGRAIADGSDPFLLVPWVDKPPLVLYLLAAAIKLFGASELALRVPGMVAGVLTVWATFGLARRLGGERVAPVAALLVALSPFAILFAPTAFTDGWLTLFITGAAWAALAGQPGAAGVLLGLASASKQQGVMAAPLVAALLVVDSIGCLEHEDAKVGEKREAPRARSILAALGLAALGFAFVFGAMTYWDSLRWHNRPSYWDQSLQTYGGVVLAPLALWPGRAAEWVRQAGYWFGAWPVTALVLGVGILCRRLTEDLSGLAKPDRSGVAES